MSKTIAAKTPWLLAGVLGACLMQAAPPERTITVREYQDKVQGAWIGQVIGAIFGWPFEGRPKSVVHLDHYLPSHHFQTNYEYAPVDDDYFYEMVALYGFERFGPNMTVEQLGDVWKEHQAGSWGSSLEARLLMEKGIRAPDTGHPRYNKWFHTIGPQFSSDIYGMIAPGMINLAGAIARRYSHVNGYAEGSDGAVFVASCVSQAFFRRNPEDIVRRAAQMIDPRSNYRKAIDQVLDGHARGVSWRDLAHQTEMRWRPDYPQVNNAVANGALVAIGVLYGDGDFLRSMNVVTQLADFADTDCNAANVGSILGAMNGVNAIPGNLKAQFHDRIWGESMGPVKFDHVVEEKISDLASRIAAFGLKNLAANGVTARRESGEEVLHIPDEDPRTQALEYFDINDYGPLWNPAWKLDAAGRGGAGTTWLDGDALITFPRDARPVRLETDAAIPSGRPRLTVDVAADAGKPWRLEVFVDDESIHVETVDSPWHAVTVDLARFAGRKANVRLYQEAINAVPQSAWWRKARIGD